MLKKSPCESYLFLYHPRSHWRVGCNQKDFVKVLGNWFHSNWDWSQQKYCHLLCCCFWLRCWCHVYLTYFLFLFFRWIKHHGSRLKKCALPWRKSKKPTSKRYGKTIAVFSGFSCPFYPRGDGDSGIYGAFCSRSVSTLRTCETTVWSVLCTELCKQDSRVLAVEQPLSFSFLPTKGKRSVTLTRITCSFCLLIWSGIYDL